MFPGRKDSKYNSSESEDSLTNSKATAVAKGDVRGEMWRVRGRETKKATQVG